MTRSKPADLHRREHVGQGGADLAAEVARRQRAHEDARPASPACRPAPGRDRVHADAVAEQRAAALPARRVDADDGDLQRVALVEAQAPDQLVGEARLAGAAGAGDADHRRLQRRRRASRSSSRSGARRGAALERRDQPRERAPGRLAWAADRRRARSARSGRGRRRSASSSRRSCPPGPCAGRLRGCRCARRRRRAARRSRSATITPPPPPKTWMCAPPRALQQVDHVLEVLDVAALVRADGDALHVFLQRRRDDLVDRAVVAEVDHLGAHALQDAPHDVDRRVVAVEQRSPR